MTVTIYHNPRCQTSRTTLSLIRSAGIEPEIVLYLETPPSRDTVRFLSEQIGLGMRGLLRRRGTPFGDLGLDEPSLSDDALLDAIERHPVLIERPIVASPKGVRLCRPPELVLEVLPDISEQE